MRKTKYRRTRQVGEGAHGVVWEAEPYQEDEVTDGPEQDDVDKRKEEDLRKLPKVVAVKKIRLKSSSEGLSRDAIREIKILQELDHPNVIKVFDVFSHRSNVNLVIEFMHHDLLKVISDPNIALSRADIKSYMLMLVRAMEHCHHNWILHRDVKPGNLLIGGDGVMKLADFGLAKVFGSPEHELSPQACTIWYRAPEMLFGGRFYGTGADMWSVGCIFAELLIKEPLFKGTAEMHQLSLIFGLLGTPTEEDWPEAKFLPTYCQFEPIPARPLKTVFPGVDATALNLLSKLLCLNPTKRLTATQALAHPYFTTGEPPTPPGDLPVPGPSSKDNN